MLIDKYFSKTKNAIAKDIIATYGVFLRRDVVCAIDFAVEFINGQVPDAKITRYYEEGAFVPAESPLFSYTGRLSEIVELETTILQKVGFACVCAANAYKMCTVLPSVGFLDMHARHACGEEMTMLCSYGASVGSRSAKLAGAVGFQNSSIDETACFFGQSVSAGTMPHVLIGYAGSTLAAAKLFVEFNPMDRFIVALVDYYGQEVDDALKVAAWYVKELSHKGYSLGIRLDTHGGRFAQDLDYDESVRIMEKWLHQNGKWPIVRTVMGQDAFDVADDAMRDRFAKLLFGTGVSAANIVQMRNTLDRFGYESVKIVASSGFNLRKCKVMANANVPIDIIGTGSFLPETLAETYATCDCLAYNGVPSVKVGREFLMNAVLGYR